VKVRPAPGLLLLGTVAVALGLACFFWNAAWLFMPILAALAVVLSIFDLRGLRRKLAGLSVRRELPNAVQRDAPFTVSLVIENSGNEEAIGEVRDLVPNEARPASWRTPIRVAPGKSETVANVLRIPIRGLHAFGAVWVRVQGGYGMLEAQRAFDCPGEIKVLPDSAVSQEDLRKSALDEKRFLGQTKQTRMRGEGLEFESLSEFRRGDDVRRIDWRATARRSRFIVRRYQVEQHRDLVILIDCGRLMGTDAGAGTKLDRAVDAALMLGRVALERGDRCGVGLFDDQVLGYLPPISGPHALRAITDCVHNVQSRWRESNFGAMFALLQVRQPKRSLVIVLSDIVDPDTSERLRTALAALARRHVVIFTALKTPLLWETARTAIDSMRDVARKAVVMRLLRERERALHLVDRAGIHVLDVEPSRLTVPLVNHYIDLRERNVL
jgi:uncharacterized protein (DUF58 family)